MIGAALKLDFTSQFGTCNDACLEKLKRGHFDNSNI